MPLQGLLRILRVAEIALAYGRIGWIYLCGWCEGVDDVRIGYRFILRSHVRGMLSMISRVHVRLGLARGGHASQHHHQATRGLHCPSSNCGSKRVCCMPIRHHHGIRNLQSAVCGPPAHGFMPLNPNCDGSWILGLLLLLLPPPPP